MASSEVVQVESDGEQEVNNTNESGAVVQDTLVTSAADPKRSRRKESHQPRHASPVEFELISLADNPLSTEPMASNIQSEVFELPKELKELATQLSNERVRINFMLELCGMDKIDFSVLTEPELLEAKLRTRLAKYRKQRKD